MSKLSLLLGILFLLISPSKAIGQNLESDSYRIRMGNFNMTSGTKTSTNYSLTDTVGQTAAEYFSGTGYFVQAGFQYLYTLYDFSFSVSSLLVDLGTATSGTFASVNHTLIVSAPGQGYSVTALAVTPLTNTQGSTIPDTTCDNTSCTETAAEVWVNTAVFGFGYNLSGHDAATDFTDATFFRPFPSLSAAEPPAIVMSSIQAGQNRTATVTYQLNVSPTQAAGNYSTQIIYTATPVY